MNPVDAVRAFVADTVKLQQQLLADEPLLAQVADVAGLITTALQRGNKLMLAGNGGSAADSQHIAAELVSRFGFDRPGLAAIALTTDTSALTAIGNDYGYEQVFARQIQAIGRAGDVFVGISTSGNSPNVIRAVEACKAGGITTVALCGSGGALKSLCDHALAMPSAHTPRIQECHIVIGHALCALIEDTLFGALRPAA